jgi:hypothetical protein
VTEHTGPHEPQPAAPLDDDAVVARELSRARELVALAVGRRKGAPMSNKRIMVLGVIVGIVITAIIAPLLLAPKVLVKPRPPAHVVVHDAHYKLTQFSLYERGLPADDAAANYVIKYAVRSETGDGAVLYALSDHQQCWGVVITVDPGTGSTIVGAAQRVAAGNCVDQS